MSNEIPKIVVLDERYIKNQEQKIIVLERRIRGLEYELMWKNLEYDGLPDLDEDVIMVSDDVFLHGYFHQNVRRSLTDTYITYFDYILDQEFSLQDLDSNTIWKYTRENEA